MRSIIRIMTALALMSIPLMANAMEENMPKVKAPTVSITKAKSAAPAQAPTKDVLEAPMETSVAAAAIAGAAPELGALEARIEAAQPLGGQGAPGLSSEDGQREPLEEVLPASVEPSSGRRTPGLSEVHVRALSKRGLWRAGRWFGPTVTVVQDRELTAEQLQALVDEPRLEVQLHFDDGSVVEEVTQLELSSRV